MSKIYRLDLNAYRMFLGERSIRVTRGQADILYALMRWPGRVLTREQLLDTLWRRNYEVSEQSVDGAIRRLRDKARAEFGTFDAIYSVRGVGYKFKV